MQGSGTDLDAFFAGNPAEVTLQGPHRNAPEIKALATAQDCGQHPLGIGGGQHKHHMGWWFLQGFKEGVEGCGGEHVAFVHHIHLPAGLHRRKAGAFDQVADVVYAGVGGGVDFDHIQGSPGTDRAAQFTLAAGFRGGPLAA